MSVLSWTGFNDPLRRHDVWLILTMAVLSACGLIYEYLMAHYAGRILGAVETTLFAMIGVMIVSMGIGAFYAKFIRCAFTGFVWLELSIACVGAFSVLVMAGLFAAAYLLPGQLQQVYAIDPSFLIEGQAFSAVHRMVDSLPFIAGFILGALVGMEIPLIARIRQHLHQQHLVHNAGTIYGADYIGGGVGAAIWVGICLHYPIMVTAVATAAVNALMGMLFLWRYRAYIRFAAVLWVLHGVLIALLVLLAIYGTRGFDGLNNLLFKDQVVLSQTSRFQQITLTQQSIAPYLPTVLSLYLNGRLQFSSSDERLYHEMLVVPAMLASARQQRVLIIGGGDGLAVRTALAWPVQQITLLELDPLMIQLFQGRNPSASASLNHRLLQLNQHALLDQRLNIIYGDALLSVESLLTQQQRFDSIIVDLPDPSHPDLNALYSDFFYAKLAQLLSGDGAITVQSSSPYHAKQAFIAIGKTLQAAGFSVEQYHANVPTFGEWGWSIGVLHGAPASVRLA